MTGYAPRAMTELSVLLALVADGPRGDLWRAVHYRRGLGALAPAQDTPKIAILIAAKDARGRDHAAIS